MRKIKEVLCLRFELGLGQAAGDRPSLCDQSKLPSENSLPAQGAVHNYLKKAATAEIHWPLPEGWDEERIEKAAFGEQRPFARPRERNYRQSRTVFRCRRRTAAGGLLRG